MLTMTQIHNQILTAGDKIRAGKAQCYILTYKDVNKLMYEMDFDYDDLQGIYKTACRYQELGKEVISITAGEWLNNGR